MKYNFKLIYFLLGMVTIVTKMDQKLSKYFAILIWAYQGELILTRLMGNKIKYKGLNRAKYPHQFINQGLASF